MLPPTTASTAFPVCPSPDGGSLHGRHDRSTSSSSCHSPKSSDCESEQVESPVLSLEPASQAPVDAPVPCLQTSPALVHVTVLEAVFMEIQRAKREVDALNVRSPHAPTCLYACVIRA